MFPYVALFSWPLVSVVFFKRFGAPIAVLVTVLAGYLLLPEKTYVNLPVLPTLDKSTIPAIAALVLALTFGVQRSDIFRSLPGLFPRFWTLRILLAVMVAGAFMTVMTNSDPLVYGPKRLVGLRPYDAFSNILTVLMFVLPMVLARKYLSSPQAHRAILLAFCIGGLVYSLFILFEVRMSPQLHRMVYGYFPHVWGQHVRGGGWRPVVFLSHGLLVGIFMCFAVLSAAGLIKSEKHRKGMFIGAAIWLFLILIVSKNLGALMISVVLLPVILFTGVRLQLIAAAVVAGTFLTYPAVRSADLVPVDRVVEFAAGISEQRAASLEYRLRHEDAMMAKASERPLFGWGGWGRNRVWDERGNDVTVSDGAWVITLGISGWVGYVGRFGLLAMPIFLLLLGRRRYNIGPETSVLALILAGNLIDLIPNASITPLSWLLAGALWGRMELGRNESPATAEVAAAGQATDRNKRGRPVAARPIRDEKPAPGSKPGYTRQTARVTHSRWTKSGS